MTQHRPASFAEPVPQPLRAWLQPFRSVFTAPTWEHALVLALGAVLAPGKRTVTAALRVTGRDTATNFTRYHQVLNRARWSSRAAARVLLELIVTALVGDEPVVIGLDDTIERRWGPKIAARGIYRDPVRSSHSHFVKTSGLRWLCFMVLVPVPWLGGIRALPVLSILAPSKGYNTARGRSHKRLTDWARQGMLQLVRWLPDRRVVFVGDSSFAVIELLAAVRSRCTVISRLRLDANLREPPPPRTGKRGRPAKQGAALPKLKDQAVDPRTSWRRVTVNSWYGNQTRTLELATGTASWNRKGDHVPLRWVLVKDAESDRELQAFFSTDPDLTPEAIVAYFVRRWQVEVTFAEARAHLGAETQRQWNDLAILRTTPALLGFYSLVCLWSGELIAKAVGPRGAVWYPKTAFTFSDAIGLVRYQLWLGGINPMSAENLDRAKIPPGLFKRMASALCYAA
jgi:hypothetical protein